MLSTTFIGYELLRYFNAEHDKAYTPEAFFDEVLYPVLLNDAKRAMHVTNSPFVQGLKKGEQITEQLQSKQYHIFKEKLNNSSFIDASLAPGHPSQLNSTTSGQAGSRGKKVNEHAFAAWAGFACGIGCNGGVNVFLDNKDILLRIQHGWHLYRELLNSDPLMKGNQIEAWNGVYLFLSLKYPQDPLSHLVEHILVDNKGGDSRISSINYQVLLVELSRHYGDLMGYIYSFGQMNTSGGIIPFTLSSVTGIMGTIEAVRKQLNYEHAVDLSKLGLGSLLAIAKKGRYDLESLLDILAADIFNGKKAITFPKTPKDYEKYIVIKALLEMNASEKSKMIALQLAGKLLEYEATSDRGKTYKSNRIKQLLACQNQNNYKSLLLQVYQAMHPDAVLKECILYLDVIKSRREFLEFITQTKMNYQIKESH